MTKKFAEQVKKESMEQYGFGPDAMKKIKVCARCGKANPGEAKVCETCGADLPSETLYQVYKSRHLSCPYCDAVLTEPVEFCPQCGKKIK